MKASFLYTANLEYQLKAAKQQILDFQSGKKYVKMQEKHQKVVRALERKIKELEAELVRAHRETVDVRNQWFDVFEDLKKEYEQKEAALLKEIKLLEQRALRAEAARDAAQNKVTQQRHQLYDIGTKLEEEQGKNLKLQAQIHRDYETSAIPSSKLIHHKKITNSREKTGKKPGGQPGHVGHKRTQQVPTKEPILLLPPQEILTDPDFKQTKTTIIKQKIGIQVQLDVTEYHAVVYYNAKTGERVHAAFPDGVINEVNYDGSVKAFLFLLTNDCCVSIDKSRNFLSELTEGKLNISKGMIHQLSKEFAMKTEQEQKEVYADLLVSPVMHVDCTNAKVNGYNAYVFVCATPDGKALYFARNKKGHEGVKGTPVEDYQGILIHDHDTTFYHYGSDHQECLAHILRYLKDSMNNESERTWNKQMYALIQKMIHYRNHLSDESDPDDETVMQLISSYEEILKKAKEEYEYIPPSEYYKEGYNLYRRMEKYRSNHLLFLHNHKVAATNNEAERLLRKYKRKQQQAVSFRHIDSIDYLCQSMSMLNKIRHKGGATVFEQVANIFG